ncbi:DoxX family membrane protein [Bizionia myxarmorum]|nr:DoxX family membrane protein [Bizionia myxarmorum]
MIAYGVYMTELNAALLILIGLRIRLASEVFFFEMITTMFLAHSENIFAL